MNDVARYQENFMKPGGPRDLTLRPSFADSALEDNKVGTVQEGLRRTASRRG